MLHNKGSLFGTQSVHMDENPFLYIIIVWPFNRIDRKMHIAKFSLCRYILIMVSSSYGSLMRNPLIGLLFHKKTCARISSILHLCFWSILLSTSSSSSSSASSSSPSALCTYKKVTCNFQGPRLPS